MSRINHVLISGSYASAMSVVAIQAWASLYVAVAICASICSGLALAATAWHIWAGTWRPNCSTPGGMVLALPRIWLHWQIQYLTGAPVVAAIALIYAYHLGFGTLAGM